jgi:hypothetical protein
LNLQPAGVAGEIYVELRAAVHPDPLVSYSELLAHETKQPVGDVPGLVAAMVAHSMATDRTFARIGGICLLTNKYEQPTFG